MVEQKLEANEKINFSIILWAVLGVFPFVRVVSIRIWNENQVKD